MTEPLPPFPDNWTAGVIVPKRLPDGTWGGEIVMGKVRYHLRAYRKEGDQVLFEFQELRDPEWEEWLERHSKLLSAG